MLPAASRATALSVCEPFDERRGVQSTEYGLAVSADPTLAPSTRNCTLCTPTLSEAVAVTVTVPRRSRPAAGALIDTFGAVVSFVTTALAWLEAALALPAASAAITR